MDKERVITIAREYARRISEEFSPDEIFLFGSHTKNTASELSDIDIAVVFDVFSGNRLEASQRLWQIAWESDGFIEPVIIEKQHDSSGFFSEVKKTGISLYSALTTEKNTEVII